MTFFVKRIIALSAVLMAEASAFALVGDGERHDDKYGGSSSYFDRSVNYSRAWLEAEWPHDGGIMTGTSADGPLTWGAAKGCESQWSWSASYLNQNIADWEVGGLNFEKMTARLYGNDIKIVGLDPHISATAHDPYTWPLTTAVANKTFYWMWIDLTLRGNGDKPLVMKPSGPIFMNKQPFNFTYFEVAGGTLVLTNNTMDFSSAVPLHLTSGTLLVTPPNGATMDFNELVSRDGHGILTMTNNATLDITNLKRQPGGILDVRTSNGGKVLAKGLAKGTAIDGGLINVSGRDIKFLDNSESGGLTPGSGTASNARVIGTSSDSAGTVNTGDISEDYIYRPAIASGTMTLKLNGKVTSENGVTIASPRTTGARPLIDFSSMPSCDKEVRIQGFGTPDTVVSSAKAFPITSGGTLTVLGRSTGTPMENTRITFLYDAGAVVDCNLKLAGGGYDGTDAIYYNNTTWSSGAFNIKGAVELLSDTAIRSPNPACIIFNQPVTGHGGLRFGGGRMKFVSSENNFDGTLKIVNSDSMQSWVFLSGGARLGAGDINLGKDAKLVYSDAGEYALDNHFTSETGNIYVQNSHIEFMHKTRVGDLRVGDAHTQDVAVVFHKDFRAGYALTEESYGQPNEKKITIRAAENDVTFTVGDDSGQHSFLDGDLEDGTGGGKLSITKVGKNSILTIGGTNNTYSGKTKVVEGTLRLGTSLFSKYDSSLWLDASDMSTVVTTVNNRVTRWTDQFGRYYFYGEGDKTTGKVGSSPFLAVSNSPSAYMNNLPFINFNFYGNGPYERLVPGPANNLQIRTVFICCNGRTGSGNTHAGGGFIQYNSADCSIRTGTSGGFSTNYETGNAWPSGLGYGYQNGGRANYLYTGGTYVDDPNGANVVNFFNLRAFTSGCNYYEHVDEFRPYIGGTDRIWGGDIGEILMFPRMLNAAECNEVLNYLLQKWNPTLYATKKKSAAETARSRVNFLPKTADVEIATEGILDLNGATQTVSRISGSGVITNSAEGVALLTVTDESSFSGRITGNVIVTLPTADAAIQVRNGATLVMSGTGEGEVTVSNSEPATHSLQCWLDATYEGTIETDSNGYVKKWSCRPGVTCAGAYVDDNGVVARRPRYDANGICANKPAIHFNTITNVMMLKDSKGTYVQTDYGYNKVATLFYVTRIDPKSFSPSFYAFGLSGDDQGLYIQGYSTYSSWSVRGLSRMCSAGDNVHVNGVDITDYIKTNGIYVVNGTNAVVFAARYSDAHLNSPRITNLSGPISLGSYSNYRGCHQYIAEVICYTNTLTDTEFSATEKYLMDKWVTSGTSWPTKETVAIADDSGVGVANGATMDVGDAAVTVSALATDGNGGSIKTSKLTVNDKFVIYPLGDYGAMRLKPLTINGDLAIGDDATVEIVDYEGLERYYRHEAISVSGTISGTNQLPQEKTNVTASRWKWTRAGNAWCVIFDNSIGITIW